MLWLSEGIPRTSHQASPQPQLLHTLVDAVAQFDLAPSLLPHTPVGQPSCGDPEEPLSGPLQPPDSDTPAGAMAYPGLASTKLPAAILKIPQSA